MMTSTQVTLMVTSTKVIDSDDDIHLETPMMASAQVTLMMTYAQVTLLRTHSGDDDLND